MRGAETGGDRDLGLLVADAQSLTVVLLPDAGQGPLVEVADQGVTHQVTG